ncbi:MAG: hypothetical protein HKN98_11190 [Silicimonas sp.]|nr:hypothetical protein [Silicimonas sp.]NNF92153.1 hypothetical protein [Boseongicola sp.]
MAEHAENDVGFGLMRALSRVRGMSRVTTMVESVELNEKREKSASQLAAKRQALKDQAEHHNALELWPLPGLAPMTRVRTNFGDVHSIALRKGDKVLTKTGEYLRIEWVNRIMLDEHILKLKPDSNPIVLGAGSLNSGVPSTEMMVSPRQVICSDERSGLPKSREASMLLSRPGVRRINETGLTYTMFHVGETADIYCEGIYLRFPIET